MINKPNLDKQQSKMKYRISSLYALLVLVIAIMIAIVISMKPIDSITSERHSMNIKLFYFDGNIDTKGVTLSDADSRRIQSFNDNQICVSVFRTADVDETVVKNFVLSWLYARYPNINITDDSIVYKSSRWRKSHEACDDAYMSNVFQYDKRKAQTEVSMDNALTNWVKSGVLLFFGALNVIMVLLFISKYRDELNHYNSR